MDASGIVRYLDERFEKFEMPMFSNMNIDYLSSRMSVYTSADRWLLMFNSIVWWPAADGLQGMVELVGPGVIGAQGFDDDRTTCPGVVEFDDAGEEVIAVSVRGQPIPISDLAVEPDPDLHADSGFWTAVALLDGHRDALLASEAELSAFIPPGFTLKFETDAWDHPDFDTPPSRTETFPALAAAIVSGDFSALRSCSSPNTHWSHWHPK